MSAQVVELASATAVEAAWEQHCAFARRLINDPKLLYDRPFMEAATRAEHRWKSLFMMQERVA